jgi:hypothetical protein
MALVVCKLETQIPVEGVTVGITHLGLKLKLRI